MQENDIEQLNKFFNFEVTPTTYIVKDGAIVQEQRGIMDLETFQSLIDEFFN